MSSLPILSPRVETSRVEVGGAGKAYTARECSCYEAAPWRFVIQLTVFHKRAAAEVDFYDATPIQGAAWGQGAWRLVKAVPLAERPTYNVLLDDGDRSTCDCPHGTYRPNAGPCRHVLALAALIASGKLPSARPAPQPVAKPPAAVADYQTNADADAVWGPDEVVGLAPLPEAPRPAGKPSFVPAFDDL